MQLQLVDEPFAGRGSRCFSQVLHDAVVHTRLAWSPETAQLSAGRTPSCLVLQCACKCDPPLLVHFQNALLYFSHMMHFFQTYENKYSFFVIYKNIFDILVPYFDNKAQIIQLQPQKCSQKKKFMQMCSTAPCFATSAASRTHPSITKKKNLSWNLYGAQKKEFV